MNTNTRPTKLALAFAALVAIGAADGDADSGSSVLNTQFSNYGGDNDGYHAQSQASSYSGYNQGYSQYNNGGQQHRDKDDQYNNGYQNGYQNGANNYNSNAFIQSSYQQFIPLVQQPVAYQNTGYNNQNWHQQQNNIINPPQTGNYLFTNNAQLINSNNPYSGPNNGQSVLIQGINQYIPGQGLYPSDPNNFYGANLDNDKERRHQRKGNDHDGRQNGQNGQGGYAYGQNLMIIDPTQGIPNQNTYFPANDHDTGVVSQTSPLIWNGYPTNFNRQYINSLPPAPINPDLNGPDINDPRTWGAQYKDGIRAPVVNDQYLKLQAATTASLYSVPPVYPLIPGSSLNLIPPGSLVGIPLNPNNQDNDGRNGGRHGDGDRDGDKDNRGQGYNGEAQTQNLRTNGCEKC